jgi:hypothetical protein
MTTVTISQPGGDVILGTTTITLELGTRGPSGQGSAVFEFSQGSPSAAWVLNHNLGYRPGTVTVFSPGGQEVEVGVIHNSLNQLTIEFAAPYVGTARVV